MRQGAGDHDAEARLETGVAREVVKGGGGEGHAGEVGGEGVEEGGLGVGGEVGGSDEGDGEGVVEDEALGELGEGDEVAHPGAGEDGYMGMSWASSRFHDNLLQSCVPLHRSEGCSGYFIKY